MDAIVLHHILLVTDFHSVEANLRQSFRILAAGRPGADVLEMKGVSVASLGVKFQMFNAAFLNSPVESQDDLEDRVETARAHFRSRGLPWALWVCEDWLHGRVRRNLTQTCVRFGMRLSSELPGMTAHPPLIPSRRALPRLEYLRADLPRVMNDFRAIGSVSFNVPIGWFSEVFEAGAAGREEFHCYVGYQDGMPVATSASLRDGGVTGVYNVATAPGFRGRGFGEAITRYTIASAPGPVVLQSTSKGLPLYERLGFRIATHILVYNSLWS